MNKLKIYLCTISLLVFTSQSFAASAVCYGSPTCTPYIQGCHDISVNKAPNGKTLNRLCQSCVLAQGNGSEVTAFYEIFLDPNNGNLNSLSCTSIIAPFDAGYKADFNALCDSRGGVPSADGDITLVCTFAVSP